MTPREVIARAIYGSFCERELEKFDYHYDSFDDLTYPIRDNYLSQADAVISALESMRATEAMERVHDEVGCLSTTEVWRAMVGAMRESK